MALSRQMIKMSQTVARKKVFYFLIVGNIEKYQISYLFTVHFIIHNIERDFWVFMEKLKNPDLNPFLKIITTFSKVA